MDKQHNEIVFIVAAIGKLSILIKAGECPINSIFVFGKGRGEKKRNLIDFTIFEKLAKKIQAQASTSSK